MSVFAEVLAFIGARNSRSFESLALRVFRHQFESIAPYRDYCLEKGARPETIASIGDIPVVSTAAFKYAKLGCGIAHRVFVTSGTTIGPGARGRHFIPNLQVYRASAVCHLARMLFPDGIKMRMLALHPTADLMPESSLAQMISWCVEEFGSGRASCAATREGIATVKAREFLLESAKAGEPVAILGTTAAFGTLFREFSEPGEPIPLAPGSRIMDTGGVKGQRIPLTLDDMIAAAGRWLGIPAELVINEYGMTELCSQLYDATPFNSSGSVPPPESGVRAKLAPPWMRAFVLDPVTMKRMPDGEVGMLSFFDLANVGSVSAIVTEDFGKVAGDAVFVLGRAAGDIRGCALGIAEFAESENRDSATAMGR